MWAYFLRGRAATRERDYPDADIVAFNNGDTVELVACHTSRRGRRRDVATIELDRADLAEILRTIEARTVMRTLDCCADRSSTRE